MYGFLSKTRKNLFKILKEMKEIIIREEFFHYFMLHLSGKYILIYIEKEMPLDPPKCIH